MGSEDRCESSFSCSFVLMIMLNTPLNLVWCRRCLHLKAEHSAVPCSFGGRVSGSLVAVGMKWEHPLAEKLIPNFRKLNA